MYQELDLFTIPCESSIVADACVGTARMHLNLQRLIAVFNALETSFSIGLLLFAAFMMENKCRREPPCRPAF
jgi:hypothetical protein